MTGDSNDSLQPVAALLAAALPGAGQFFLGYRARGICISIGVLGLFFGGLFMGGLSSIDSRENRIWFIGQALTGPVAFIADGIHQTFYKGAHATGPNAGKPVSPGPDETITQSPSGARMLAHSSGPPAIVKSLGRPNELGVLFAAIAGMLNLICFIDAAWSHRREHHIPATDARATGLPPPPDSPTSGSPSGGKPVSSGAAA